MDDSVGGLLRTLLRAIFDLGPPDGDDPERSVQRPEGLPLPNRQWLEQIAEAIAVEVLLSFDLCEKRIDDSPVEVEKWLRAPPDVEWAEQRKNHRLRIRTAVDDLFEGSLAQAEVPASLRAWKIQIADACADGILERFYLRPASAGPHATCRRMMYEVGQELQRALGHRSLFLVSGRSAEVQAMEEAIARASEALDELKRVLRDEPSGD
jgi:hypothetical protein